MSVTGENLDSVWSPKLLLHRPATVTGPDTVQAVSLHTLNLVRSAHNRCTSARCGLVQLPDSSATHPA